jgi:hypothetical protein
VHIQASRGLIKHYIVPGRVLYSTDSSTTVLDAEVDYLLNRLRNGTFMLGDRISLPTGAWIEKRNVIRGLHDMPDSGGMDTDRDQEHGYKTQVQQVALQWLVCRAQSRYRRGWGTSCSRQSVCVAILDLLCRPELAGESPRAVCWSSTAGSIQGVAASCAVESTASTALALDTQEQTALNRPARRSRRTWSGLAVVLPSTARRSVSPTAHELRINPC